MKFNNIIWLPVQIWLSLHSGFHFNVAHKSTQGVSSVILINSNFFFSI